MARRPRLPQRNPERRAGWAAAGRGRPLRHLVRSDPARQHRPPRSPHPSRPHPHRPAEARAFDGKRIRVPHNPTGPATTITDMNQTGILLPMSPDKSVNHVPSCTRGLFCHDNGLPLTDDRARTRRTPGGVQSPLPLLVTLYPGMPNALRTAIGAGPISLAHTQLTMRAPGAAAATRPTPGGSSFRSSLFRFMAWPIISALPLAMFLPRADQPPAQSDKANHAPPATG